MTHFQLHTLLLDAQDCTTIDEYISECGGNVPAEYISEDGDPTAAVELLTALWQFRDGIRFRQLREYSGMYLAEFARHYGIPKRSVENWDANVTTPPAYLLELLLCDIMNMKTEEVSQ